MSNLENAARSLGYEYTRLNCGFPDEEECVHLPDVKYKHGDINYIFRRMRLLRSRTGGMRITQFAPFSHPHVSGGGFCMGDNSSVFDRAAIAYDRYPTEQNALTLIVTAMTISQNIYLRGAYHGPVLESEESSCICRGGSIACQGCMRGDGAHFLDFVSVDGISVSVADGVVHICPSCGSPSSHPSICPVTRSIVCEICGVSHSGTRYSATAVIRPRSGNLYPVDMEIFTQERSGA